jgi:hypothetical protein
LRYRNDTNQWVVLGTLDSGVFQVAKVLEDACFQAEAHGGGTKMVKQAV